MIEYSREDFRARLEGLPDQAKPICCLGTACPIAELFGCSNFQAEELDTELAWAIDDAEKTWGELTPFDVICIINQLEAGKLSYTPDLEFVEDEGL